MRKSHRDMTEFERKRANEYQKEWRRKRRALARGDAPESPADVPELVDEEPALRPPTVVMGIRERVRAKLGEARAA